MPIKDRKHNALQVGALIVTGLGIGWLAGLSASPVVSIVITSVTGSAAAVVAALSGLKSDTTDKPQPWKIDPMPLGLLILGLIIGSLMGLYLRTHNALSPSALTLSEEITQWTNAGLDKDKVVTRLFDRQYPLSATGESTATTGQNSAMTLLFTEEAPKTCKTLMDLVAKKDYNDLRTELLSSSVPPLRELPSIITDTMMLVQIVEKVLCADTASS
jgi:hypothetical protein